MRADRDRSETPATRARERELDARYLELDFPQRFDLQVFESGWWSHLIAGPEDFERQTDGSYVCSPGYTLCFIRCVEKQEDHFIHVDGDGRGRRFKYRLMPVEGLLQFRP